jgi:hypothetical protein
MKVFNFLKQESRAKLLFFFVGIASIVWFMIRVIPKPSRATYPCMKATAPIMSGFVVYLVTLFGTIFAFRKAQEKYRNAKYSIAFLFALLAVITTGIFFANNVQNSIAATPLKLEVLEAPNTPIGTSKGYWPGRVTWVMDKNATDETAEGEWHSRTNQNIVTEMLANGIKRYADTTNLKDAWDCLFKSFNVNHSKGWVGYTQGEKIMIKVNHTNLGAGGHTFVSGLMVCTPELIYALLEQLIDSVGVAQADITIGDPYRGFPDTTYNMCYTKYPNVHYIEGTASEGREQTALSTEDVFFTSDGSFQSRLPQAYLDAEYLINLPSLKSHNSAGITLASKNHQGSVIHDSQNTGNQSMINYLHNTYPNDPLKQDMKIYRHIVDFMAHSKLGGNTLVFIIDAIWSGRNWNGFVDKFGMAPFNNDYTSSIFISQDEVAIESVGFDFLYNEYKEYPANHNNASYPLWAGVQDYIHQAANVDERPSDISYDPDHEDHSQPVGSLGAHEHWNNATDMQYSVNLTGNKGGIELVSVPEDLVESVPLNYNHETDPSTKVKVEYVNNLKVYPNPARSFVKITYSLTENSQVCFELFSVDGKKVSTLMNKKISSGNQTSEIALNVKTGLYIAKLICRSNSKTSISTTNLVVK